MLIWPLCSTGLRAGVVAAIIVVVAVVIGVLTFISTVYLLRSRKKVTKCDKDENHPPSSPDLDTVQKASSSSHIVSGTLAGAQYVDLRGSHFDIPIPQRIKNPFDRQVLVLTIIKISIILTQSIQCLGFHQSAVVLRTAYYRRLVTIRLPKRGGIFRQAIPIGRTMKKMTCGTLNGLPDLDVFGLGFGHSY